MSLLDDRRRLSAAVTLLLAVAVLALAWGSDSSVTARAAVGDATGPLIADSLAGGAILSTAGMRPGDSTTGEIMVTNVGDSAGDMALSATDLADATVHGGVLSRVLQLAVLDVTPGRAPAVVYAGALAGLHVAALGAFEQGDAHRYRFTVTYPLGLAPGVDDSLQGASTRVSFVWTATGSGLTTTAPPPVIEDHVGPSEHPGHLKLRVYIHRRQAAHRPQVYVNVHCSDRCTLTATGHVSVPSQKAHWTTKPLKGGVTRAGTVKLRLALSEKALRTLNRAVLHRERASVKLDIVAKSGTQTVRWTRTIRLAR